MDFKDEMHSERFDPAPPPSRENSARYPYPTLPSFLAWLVLRGKIVMSNERERDRAI